ncbi:FAD-binding oxidoreductase [Leifsonia kafniensis]|uniref:FAD-binding oxidoreductase n=1 Tax=Leifsonia kafniensis TaxID=475957 RepID=A0ABP7KM22_9MICO
MTSAIAETDRVLTGLLGQRLVTRERDDFTAIAAVTYAADDLEPALIAQPESVRDVQEIVRTAARTGIPFAVRGRGHSFARHGTVAGGLVMDLRRMDACRIDADGRVGRASASTTTGAYTMAAAAMHLATGFGDHPDVGVPGLLLGGGIGYLSRRDGLTIDALIDAQLVLADGSVVRAAANENEDLFWGLRGGGGNFGVVTSLSMRLEHTPMVTGGLVVFEASGATVAALFEAGLHAPDALSLMINVTRGPRAPFLPEQFHGRPIVTAIMCHSGNPEEAAAALAPVRAAGKVIVDNIKVGPYPALFALAADQAGTRTVRRTGFLDSISEDDANSALELVAAAPTEVALVNLRPMGGAIARVDTGATAFAHRDRGAIATIRSIDHDPAKVIEGAEWADRTAALLRIGGAANVNFLGGDIENGAALAYPPQTLTRLREIKSRYDGDNLFRSNHNIG